jgi:hypothetical protein
MVLAAVLILFITALAYVALPTPYQSQAVLAMAAPTTGNPYLTFTGALTADVDLLSRNLTSQSSAQALQALGLSGKSYTAGIPLNALGPFLQLTVTGSNKAQVSRSIQVLVTFAEQQWRALQESSSTSASHALVTLSVIVPPNTPTASLKRKVEEVAGVAIVGIVLAVLFGNFIDGASRRRRTSVQQMDSRFAERSPQAAPMR